MSAMAPHFSIVKFTRSLIGLVLAPIVGGGIVFAIYAMTSVAWSVANQGWLGNEFDYIGSALAIGLQGGLQLGVAPALILGWPMHLALLRTGFIHLQTYFTFGAALAVIGFLIITQLLFRTPRSGAELPYAFTLLIAAAGAVGATLFWFIRRPDRDNPEPTAPSPPEPQS